MKFSLFGNFQVKLSLTIKFDSLWVLTQNLTLSHFFRKVGVVCSCLRLLALKSEPCQTSSTTSQTSLKSVDSIFYQTTLIPSHRVYFQSSKVICDCFSVLIFRSCCCVQKSVQKIQLIFANCAVTANHKIRVALINSRVDPSARLVSH